ncbi:glycosyltransferase [Desulfogranum marinum]|uniref:glycosyltransferase n=1 Tax=Desulfogranum marinum TaxID=453220 RepID=UPI0029C80363|nr:glycosyltransferase [Desulfogranum marinum]
MASYILYPAILMILCLFAREEKNSNYSFFPRTVTLVSAYNEEKHILNRINNFLSSDYPPDKSKIIVISDASSDKTDLLVQQIKSNRVKLVRQEKRLGKTSALNMCLGEVNNSIIIFTDSNTCFTKEAIFQLTRPFSDPKVGLVSGLQLYKKTNGEFNTLGLYSKYEFYLKKLESRIGSLAGADGAIYAIKGELFETIPNAYINDFYHPMNITNRGYKVVFQKNALAYEESDESFANEINRQIRITTQSAYIFRKEFLNLIVNKNYKALICYTGHKAMRWITIVWLFLFFAINLIQATFYSSYRELLILQIIFYTICLIGSFSNFLKIKLPYICMMSNFIEINCAMFVGFVKSFKKEINSTWNVRSK